MKQESIVQSNNELLNDKRVLMVNPKDEVSVKTIKTDSRGYTRLIDQYCSNHFGKSFTFKDFNNWLVNRGIKVVQNNGTTALMQAIFVSYISLDLSQYLGQILVETAMPFPLLTDLQTPVELDNQSNYGFDFDYRILQCS